MKAALLLAVTAGLAQAAPATSLQWQALVNMFDGVLHQDRVVGGSVALVSDGALLARHDYGLADRAAGRSMDGDTVMHWGSITKTLTAITIMQLRDRGRLSLEDPVTRYLPELRRVHNPHGSMDDITIRMLLDHSAGFQAPTWPYKQGEPWEPFEPTSWEQLVAMMPYERIAFEPGSRYGYSNPTWIYLARIVEIISGDPWESYVQKNLFAPLGMTRSFFRLSPYHLQEHRSHRYAVRRDEAGTVSVEDLGSEFDPGITVPNGGWNAPVADTAAYVSFLTGVTGDAARQRCFDGVLGRQTLEEMWRPRFHAPTKIDTAWMGLSFFVDGEGGRRIVGHTGSQGGYTAFIYFNPRRRLGVVAVFNTDNSVEGYRRSFFAIQDAALKVLR
jgi:CubicO group peptidase (beta-lactamase class C family)